MVSSFVIYMWLQLHTLRLVCYCLYHIVGQKLCILICIYIDKLYKQSHSNFTIFNFDHRTELWMKKRESYLEDTAWKEQKIIERKKHFGKSYHINLIHIYNSKLRSTWRQHWKRWWSRRIKWHTRTDDYRHKWNRRIWN